MRNRKRIVGWVLVALGVIAALLAVGVLVLEVRGIPRYPIERVELKVEVTPERVARGKKWSSMLCTECHIDPETRQLTGKRLVDAPASFGVVYSKNITQHPEKGIGQWTDGELAFLIRTGVRRDGQYVPPPMPKFPYMADEDVASIIAFLRSNDPLVASSDKDDQESQPSLLLKFLCTVAMKPILPYPKEPIAAPSTGDKLAYGKYLTFNLQCHECHSKDFATNRLPPETSAGYMGGGSLMLDLSGKKIYTPNITMDEATGIGKWSDAQFRRAMHEGFRPDDSLILSPMPRESALTEDELNSMYAYFKTVPVISNRRPDAEARAPTGLTGGKATYYKYRCDSCHGESGIGQSDLRKGPAMFPANDAMIAFLKNPRATFPDTTMPAWDGVINADEYAPLVEYIRTLAPKP